MVWLVSQFVFGSSSVLYPSSLYPSPTALVSNKIIHLHLKKLSCHLRQRAFLPFTCMSTLRNIMVKKKITAPSFCVSCFKNCPVWTARDEIFTRFCFCYLKSDTIKCFCSAWLYSNMQVTQLRITQWIVSIFFIFIRKAHKNFLIGLSLGNKAGGTKANCASRQ